MILTSLILFFWGLEICSSAPLEEVRSGLCDSSVIQHSGYLNSSAEAKYFYWFFESQTNPSEAPLTIWLNGGPGCSSMVGLWQELGPCKISPDGRHTINNPYSWNKYSNILFFDQPAGAGFSFGQDDVNSSQSGAKPAYDFIVNFMKRYPKYANLPLHFFGESYSGHYIPVFADYILQQNQRVKNGLLDNPIIQLVSIGIGNGWTSPLIQMEQYPTMACNSSYGSVVSEGVCQQMLVNMPACLKRIKRCHLTDNDRDCSIADSYCNRHVVSLFDHAKRSYYDVRSVSSPPTSYVNFLNSNAIKEKIGAIGTYHECSDEVFDRFLLTGDSIRKTDTHVAGLLDNGIKVLIYAGDADYICSWYGNYAWTDKLQFNGREAYQLQSMQPWMIEGTEVGQIRSGGNLTFIRVYEAGHEVPFYQPKTSQHMFYDHIH